MKKTKYLVFCAMMAALSIVVLLLGSIGDVLDLCAVLIAATFMFVVCEELGSVAGLITYAVCAVLAVIILSIQRPVTIEYIVFGFYPALRRIFEKLPRWLCILLKISYMLVSASAMFLITRFFLETGETEIYWQILSGAIGVLCLVICDIFFKRFGRYYHARLRTLLRIDKFFS